MRHCSALLVLVLFSQCAWAAQNPQVRAYLDFDPPNRIDRIDPLPGQEFDVYIVVDCFGASGGCTGVVLAFERTFGGTLVAHRNLIGTSQLGYIENMVFGWVCGVTSGCAYPGPDGLLVVARITYEYDGPPGWIRIARQQVDGGSIIDCNVDIDPFCIAGNAGVGMEPPGPEVGCICGATPAARPSWGAIKQLYR